MPQLLLAPFALVLAGNVLTAAPVNGEPAMLDSRLQLRTVASGFTLPTSMAFIGANDFLVLEKTTGQVLRVKDGVVQGAVLDLAVNSGSERGLLGIALHPDFPTNPGVYLYWTCATAGPPVDPFVPDVQACPDPPALGADTGDLLAVPMLANRVDRFRWTGSELVYESNLIKLRQFQNDAAPTPPDQGDQGQPARGNHDGGILRFGPDKKLYVFVGDAGRRGQLQNLPSGPTLTGLGPVVADDQFGGPEPDNAHFSGIILRLNDDGTTPADNPFYAAGTAIGGEVGANIQKIYVYGVRNGFGMAFDPASGGLWFQENGEDAFDELNRAEPGMNSGWIQIQGPLSRLAEYRQIETTSTHGGEAFPDLQQLRWGPERIATTQAEAESRLFKLPGSSFRDPEFAWKYVLAPAGIGFLGSSALGPQFSNDLFVGLAVPLPLGGPLFRFRLTGNRQKLAFDDARLADRVADNATFNDLGESESLLVGQGFGIVTDIETGPNGLLYVVSLSNGAVYEISAKPKGRASNGPAAGLAFTTRPNPARGGTTIELSVATPQLVSADIFDVQGRLVRHLETRAEGQGMVALPWDGRNEAHVQAAPGVYTIRLRSAEGFANSRLVLLQ